MMHPANEKLLDALIEMIAESGEPPLEAAERMVKDAKRYRFLRVNRDRGDGQFFFIACQDSAAITRWTHTAADEQVDLAMNRVIEGKV